MTPERRKEIFDTWDNCRLPWPKTQDGTPLQIMNVPQRAACWYKLPPVNFEGIPTVKETYLTFRRVKIVNWQDDSEFDAIECEGVIVKPRHMRNYTIREGKLYYE